MPIITLPDGSKREFNQPVTVMDVAADIGAGLAKATLAGVVDGVERDASFVIESDASLQIITAKDEAGLEIIRHSTAHLLAEAIKALYPKAQITIGPVIESGFYYDISYDKNLTPEDLEKIEAKMAELAKQDREVVRKEMSRDEMIKVFEAMGEHYKVEIIKDIPADQTLSAYQQGEFMDLCRGPHVPRTGVLKAFKLTKLAGAYWRGDSNNEMLQRIYGTAWADKKQLQEYLTRLEEAERRDHRKVIQKMDLLHFQEEAPGMIFWHPNGWTLNKTMREFIRKIQDQGDYQEINTPIMADLKLWEKSGHVAKFDAGMFCCESESRDYAIKPMSCPLHIQVFKQGVKSYRDLPIRYAEFGHCHRNEPSGALHGMMRVRGMVQDDGHIFCTEAQIQNEVSLFIDQLYKVYETFGFDNIEVKLALRPEKRVGSDETWDDAEESLRQALRSKNLEWQDLPGEGAFYGPKLEFHLKDCLGRVWQCGTIQVDFNLPERLGAEYVADDNSKKHPVMLHRAILGSIERFTAILLEHYADGLPAWLAPIQVVVANITDEQVEYAQEWVEKLKNRGVRATLDLRNEKINYKIRQHTMARVPYILVVGAKEAEAGTVAVRPLQGEQQFGVSWEGFEAIISSEMMR